MDIEIDPLEKLPEDVRNFFRSNEPRLSVEQACFLYDVSEDKISNVAGNIGDIFYGDTELKNLPANISKDTNLQRDVAYGISCELLQRIFLKFPAFFTDANVLKNQWSPMKSLPKVSEEKAWKRVIEIEPWILEEEKEKEEQKKKEEADFSAKTESIAVEQALEKYPHVGEQNITGGDLKLRSFPDPVRPSIKNWIADYHDSIGAGKHSPIERGNYLFHSDNGKKLNTQDRQKLGLLLKALDDGSSVYVDIKNEQIIFNNPDQLKADTNSQNATGSSYSSSPAGTEDVFEKFAPKSLQTPHISQKLSNLENFYSKYPERRNTFTKPLQTQEKIIEGVNQADESQVKNPAPMRQTGFDQKVFSQNAQIRQPQAEFPKPSSGNAFNSPRRTQIQQPQENFSRQDAMPKRQVTSFAPNQNLRTAVNSNMHQNGTLQVQSFSSEPRKNVNENAQKNFSSQMQDQKFYKPPVEEMRNVQKQMMQPQYSNKISFNNDKDGFSGNISFTSAQKLPVEQKTQGNFGQPTDPIAKIRTEQPVAAKQPQNFIAPNYSANSYHIAPRNSARPVAAEEQLKANIKNIVDLKHES